MGVEWIVTRLLPSPHAQAMLADLDELLREASETHRSKLYLAAWCWLQVLRPATVLLSLKLRLGEEPAEGGTPGWLRDVGSGLARGCRLARRSPARTALAVGLLGGGAGTCAAVFAAVHAVYLQPLPLPEPDRLVWVFEQSAARAFQRDPVAPTNVFRWRESVSSFEDVGFFWPGCTSMVSIGQDRAPSRLCGSRVSGNFFGVLGLSAELGRVPTIEDSWIDAEQVVLLTHATWRNRFGRDPSIVGRSIVLDHTPRVVIGVMPEGVVFPEPGIDLWTPLRFDPTALDDYWFRATYAGVARLRDGVDRSAALSELTVAQQRLQDVFPEVAQNDGVSVGIAPLSELFVSSSRHVAVLLFGAVALLLAIAVLNLASFNALSLEARRVEFDVRTSLGANRRTQRRALFGENLLVVGVGTALAAGVAGALLKGLRASQYAVDLFEHTPPRMGSAVTLFLLATAAAMLLVLAPGSRRAISAPRLPRSAKVVASATFVRRARAVVSAQVALAVALSLGATLLARSMLALSAVDPGFDIDNRLVATVQLTNPPYDTPEHHHGFFRQLVSELEALPEVASAAVMSQAPLSTVWRTGGAWIRDGATEPVARDVIRRNVGSGYFETMGTRLLAGRDFGDEDDFYAPRVAIVNETFARRFFSGADPLGRSIALSDPTVAAQDPWRRVVGVVGDEHQSSPGELPRPEVFTPYEQMRWWTTGVVVHTRSDPRGLVPALRGIVADLDSGLPVYNVRTMDEIRRRSVAKERLAARFIGGFATVALVLSLVGVYGVAAIVSRFRRRELALRAALGAAPRRVTGHALSNGLRPALRGLVVGMSLSAGAARLLDGFLFGVPTLDPVSFVVVGLGFACLATLTGLSPALTARRFDLARLLREDT